MLYMNDFDFAYAGSRFARGRTPNRLVLTRVVDNLRVWADRNSDGWAYWPKPARAARSAMELIRSTTNAANHEQESHDITDAELKAALRPIKAFLTRQNVLQADRDAILRPSQPVDSH